MTRTPVTSHHSDYYEVYHNKDMTNLRKSPSRWLEPGLRAWQSTALSSVLKCLYDVFTKMMKIKWRQKSSNCLKNDLRGDSNPGYERGNQLLYLAEVFSLLTPHTEAITTLKKSPSRWLDPGLRACQPTTLPSVLQCSHEGLTQKIRSYWRKKSSNCLKIEIKYLVLEGWWVVYFIDTLKVLETCWLAIFIDIL